MKWLLLFLMGAGVLLSCNITKKVPAKATLNGSKSYDPDGYIVSFLWQQINGTGAVIYSSTKPVSIVEIPKAGVYYFKLTVTDNQGATDSDTTKIKY